MTLTSTHLPPDAANPANFDHRAGVGGLWDLMGDLQLAMLVNQGLRPHHRLLDIGCGALRAGVRLMRYLEPGHYHGLDKERALLDAGVQIEMPAFGVQDRQPRLALSDDFDLSTFGDTRFDYMIAQSVFSHLPPELIERCLAQVMPALAPGGWFLATYFQSTHGQIDPGQPHPFRRLEMKRSSYPFAMFGEMAQRLGVSVCEIEPFFHPRGQRLLGFRHPQ